MKKFFLPLIVLAAILIFGCGGEDKQINSFDDLKSARIGVWPGGLYEKLARNHFPNAQYIPVEGTVNFIEGLRQHKIDAFIIGKAYADKFKDKGIAFESKNYRQIQNFIVISSQKKVLL